MYPPNQNQIKKREAEVQKAVDNFTNRLEFEASLEKLGSSVDHVQKNGWDLYYIRVFTSAKDGTITIELKVKYDQRDSILKSEVLFWSLIP